MNEDGRPIRLHFQGPFPACSEAEDVLDGCDCRDSPGLYLWAVEQPTRSFRVSYIGETARSLYSRNKEHVIQTLGGNYRIIDADLMWQGVERVLWDGLWRLEARGRLPEFLRNYERLAPLIKRHLFGHSIFVSPFTGEDRLRRRIEGALARHLRSDQSASSLFPSDIRYFVRRATEPASSVAFSSDRLVEGLPERLLV